MLLRGIFLQNKLQSIIVLAGLKTLNVKEIIRLQNKSILKFN